MAHGPEFVPLDEATHGTQDFFHMRGRISEHLIPGQGFDALAIEGDWPGTWLEPLDVPRHWHERKEPERAA